MEKIREQYDALNKNEKLQFMKEIMPDMCKLFSENPETTMKEMMPACKSAMKESGMDMSQMMSKMMPMMMNNK